MIATCTSFVRVCMVEPQCLLPHIENCVLMLACLEHGRLKPVAVVALQLLVPALCAASKAVLSVLC